jgi:hypothetical protein
MLSSTILLSAKIICMGRPSIPYDQRIADEICERLVESRMGLEHVLDTMRAEPEFESTPTLPTIYKWMTSNKKFFEDSARARIMSADTYVDAALNEAHTARLGKISTRRMGGKDGDTEEEKITDNVERSKLIYQALMKRAGQLNPKKYGEKILHEGNEDAPLVVRHIGRE